MKMYNSHLGLRFRLWYYAEAVAYLMGWDGSTCDAMVQKLFDMLVRRALGELKTSAKATDNAKL